MATAAAAALKMDATLRHRLIVSGRRSQWMEVGSRRWTADGGLQLEVDADWRGALCAKV